MPRWEPDAAGRLMSAAIDLYDRQGYEATTVQELADAAGLTKRTYFRHFADKREVLFTGAGALQDAWVAAVHDAVQATSAVPDTVDAIGAVRAGFPVLSGFFDGRHQAATTRARIIDANPELREREAVKLESLARALTDALVTLGVDGLRAELAARVGTTVYQTAFGRWVAQPDGAALPRLLDRTLDELREVLGTPR